jgi:hypothetical protein
MLIDGELRYTDSGAKFDVIHPASEEVPVSPPTAPSGTCNVRSARRGAFDETDWSRDLTSVTTS